MNYRNLIEIFHSKNDVIKDVGPAAADWCAAKLLLIY